MKLHSKIASLIDKIGASYWFVPSCLLVFALLAAQGLLALDAHLGPDVVAGFLPFGIPQAAGARTTLSTIATAVLGVAGVTFSVTMVAVSYASGNFGPRLIGNFMRDRANQATLGIFIAAFVFAIIVLISIREPNATDSTGFVPHVSIFAALFLALISVGMLIFYIHHIPETINVSNIAAALGRDLTAGIDAICTDKKTGATMQPDARHAFENAEEDRLCRISAGTSGYVQALDVEELAAIAEDHDLHIALLHDPGDFVAGVDCMFLVSADAAPSDIVTDKMRAVFSTGSERTKFQNVEFAADQLVEIIARALSPGVNDPFTAITCLNWLRTGLHHLIEHEDRIQNCRAHPRIWRKPLTFTNMLDRVFDGSRQYIASDASVCLHAMDCLGALGFALPEGPRSERVREQLERLHEVARSALLDSEKVETRFENIEIALSYRRGHVGHEGLSSWSREFVRAHGRADVVPNPP